MTPQLVLASTSPHRRKLLERLGLPFTAIAPGCDESAHHDRGLAPAALARELARVKARAVAANHQDAVVIGADQVCALGDEVFGKPGSHAAAAAQLARLRGSTHALFTAVCVVHAGREHAFLDESRLTMRALDDKEIERYLARDRPLDCAGAYKLEQAGITLFSAIESADHTAIVGLPLLQLSAVLRQCGFTLP